MENRCHPVPTMCLGQHSVIQLRAGLKSSPTCHSIVAQCWEHSAPPAASSKVGVTAEPKCWGRRSAPPHAPVHMLYSRRCDL